MATLTTTITETPSTTVYSVPMAALEPIGKLTDDYLAVINDLSWDISGRGFFSRGEHSITFEVGGEHLIVGYSLRGKRALR